MALPSDNIIQAEMTWLTCTEFSEVSGLSSDQVHELVEMGILAPSGTTSRDWLFNGQCMTLMRLIRRLQAELDLELDLHALALSYRLLERISELESLLSEERAARRCD